MKLLRYAFLLLAITLNISALAQTSCIIKDKSTGTEVSASSSLDFTFGDSFTDRFEVSGKDGDNPLTISDFNLLLLDEGGSIIGFIDSAAPFNGDNIDPDTKYRIALQYNGGSYFPSQAGFGISVKKRVLYIDGDDYYEADKQYDALNSVNVDLEYANDHLKGFVKDDNIKVTFEAEYLNPQGQPDSRVGDGKIIRFSNIKIFGKNTKGYEFSLPDQSGSIKKNTAASGKVFWKHDNKVVKTAVSIPYGATLGTGGNLFSDIDKLEGITTNYNPYPEYYYVDLSDPNQTEYKFSASADPIMLPVGNYRIWSKFTVLPNKTAYYDDVTSNKIELTIKESKVTVVPVDAIPEYNYGESSLGIDITFKGISESGSNMPGTWRYMTEDSVWYEYGDMLPVGSYTMQAVFQPGNNNFTSKPSVFVSFEVKPRVLTVDATVPFLENTKMYDSTTAVNGINVDAANSTLCCLLEFNGVLDECYIDSISAEYNGPDVFTDNQYIRAKFKLAGAQAANYVVEDMLLNAEIKPLEINAVLNSGNYTYGDANLYEGSLKPYFVYASDPSKKVEFDVEAEPGSRWYMKSQTVSPITGDVPDGYYNTGITPIHLDALTHEIYACFQTGTQSNFKVVNNYVDENGELVGNDLSVIRVMPAALKVWYGGIPLVSTKRITKVWDGSRSLKPSDIDIAYAYGYEYKYPEDSLVFTVSGFDELSITNDTISYYSDPAVGSGKQTRVVWKLNRGGHIADNYTASAIYQNGRITKSVLPGEPDYVFEWIKEDNYYYSDNGALVELTYGSSIGTVRPMSEPRKNYTLFSDFNILYVPEEQSVFSHLPVYTYREFGSAADFRPYTDGTVLPVGEYEFKAYFKSTNLAVWEDVVTDVIVKILPIEITPFMVYENEKFYDGTTKVKVLDYGINGVLEEHKDKVRLSPSTVDGISFSDSNSGQRSITWTAMIDFDPDIKSCYKVTQTDFSDPSGFIKPIEPKVLWLFKGAEVNGSAEVPYLTEYMKDIYAVLRFDDPDQEALANGKYSDIQYSTLYGTLSADNKFLNDTYMFSASASSSDPDNFLDAMADLRVSVIPETITLVPDFQAGNFAYGSKIGIDFKYLTTNSEEATKNSDISISIRLNDDLYPYGYAPAPGTYEVSASAYDKNGVLLKGFSEKTMITINPIEAEIVPDVDDVDPNDDIIIVSQKQYDGNSAAEVISHNFKIVPISSDDVVEVEVKANFDTEKAGNDKEVYYTISLTGDDAAKYSVPDKWKNVLYSKNGVISPLIPHVYFENQTVVYGESVLGTDITASVTPELKGSYIFILDGVEIQAGAMLDVKIDNSKVASYLAQVKFVPEDVNYTSITSNYAEITVNQKIVNLVGDLTIADKYYDKTDIIDIANQVKNPEISPDDILAADADKVILSADYSKTKYPYNVAGEYKGIPVNYSLSGERAFNYKLANIGNYKYLTLTADSKIIGFNLNLDIPTDPEAGDPSDPQGGGNNQGEPGDDGIVTYTRIYGASQIGQDFKVDESLLTPGMTVEYKIDGADAMGRMLVPQFDNRLEPIPYVVNILIYQNSILIDETAIKVKVLKRQLKVADLVFPHQKEWDGNTLPSSMDAGRLTNVVDGDNISVSVTNINFDTPDVGTGKTITASFAIDGSACADWLQKYIAPDDIIYKDGVITLAKILIEDIAVSGSGFCSGESVDFSFNIKTAGSPSMYSLTFSDEDVDLGFRNVVKADLPRHSLSQTLSFTIPGGVSYGKHTAKIQLFDAAGSEGEIYDINFETAINSNILHDKFDDVVLIDNSAFQYVGYEWIKDGAIVEGENNQFLNDKPCLYGWYGANVTTVSGETVKVCPVFFDHRTVSKKSAVKSVSVYPNPAERMETVTIDLSDFDGFDFSNAEILIYSSLGVLSEKIEDVEVKNFVNLPADNYTGVVVLGDKKLSFKLIVRD